MSKHFNIVWLVIDSVRYYREQNRDARDRLVIMDKLAPEMIEFRTTVTSAPSSIMSIGAMMTGIPSYYLGRDYDTFYFDYKTFHPLPEILRDLGYNIYGILAFIDARETLGRMLGLVDRKFWPKGLKYSRSPWTNDELNEILKNLLQHGLSEPFFLYAHYNSRQDFETSEKVEWAVEQLRSHGYYDPEKTIFLMSSDHGYPDPRRGIDEDWFVRHGLSHDLLLTDENMRIPLLLRYPGCRPQRIDTMVTTLDLLPTLLDLLGINDAYHLRHRAMLRGHSLLPLIENGKTAPYEGRKVRSDARFRMQSYRRTAIRDACYKYIRNHDEGTEEFYDLERDPFEATNLIDNPSMAATIEEFRREFQKQEEDALAFHFQLIVSRVREAIGVDKGLHVGSVLVVANPEGPHLSVMLKVLGEVLGRGLVDVWRIGEERPQRGKRYDVVITLLDGVAGETRKAVMTVVRHIPRAQLLHVSANFDVDKAASRDLMFYVKYAYSRRRLYVKEPQVLWRNVKRKLKYAFKQWLARF